MMMMIATSEAQKSARDVRQVPPLDQVRPRVWSVPIECAEFPIQFTYCYLVGNDLGQFVVIDPGWESERGRRQFEVGLRMAGCSFESIIGIVVTHHHLDHIARARALSEKTGAWVAMHPAEASLLAARPTRDESATQERAWLDALGVPAEEISTMALDPALVLATRAAVAPTLLVEDGDLLPLPGRRLQVHWTPGHTPGHICIVDLDEQLVFTGDHVLPRISPNIGISAQMMGRDALGEYLESLTAMRVWDDFEVCPGHEYRFRGLAARCDQLRDHHAARCREISEVIQSTGSTSAWRTAEQLTWSRGWSSLEGGNRRGALAETLAHIEYLRRRGIIPKSTS